MKKNLWISCFLLFIIATQVSAIVLPSQYHFNTSNTHELNPILWDLENNTGTEISIYSRQEPATSMTETEQISNSPLSNVPEPATILLFGLGLAAFGLNLTLKLS